ncbi:phenylalanine--tRNA ligase subunit alpha [Streptobacillus moniliformis]|uniref:Phenylalanine--tRNA ligase alpha subunit n=1 Tax=Streptobacillus moniliformis (strain ATCC 14647 / DSM 12112 / NCTC 10651 / 9901) TaxID=519441 RepID=D1AVE8_STRM9|nr:phenylalanine--tRNA ligase subunit alpha [Streptobacillus moniliformis]ACZ01708.1 phenylalanyl-tRNA synthetase, alpha subunit [Streptobacillus moniliformis DSM 12112]AVL43299.1 phenylalanine--tRNA ligase subunit alpha [Streptobacillus moniliformis]SQA13110.1 Phenylalanine--tRNA ligase alpha subunit [Streptobacillus moniliformis]
MLEKLKLIKERALSDIEKLDSMQDFNDMKVRYLGKKGEFTAIMKEMGNIVAEKRKEFGAIANEIKTELQEKFDEKLLKLREEAKKIKLESEILDISLPGKSLEKSSLHPLTKTLFEIKEIVSEMGFDIVDGPEVESTYLNFDALNIPKTHPSRELTDTFYITDDVILRTQTSPVQIRYMKEHKPPFKMISIGKVYRPDYDVSHTPMFHQVEGLMIGEDVSFSNFKATLESIVQRIFGADRNVRFRPHFFPFTEPSAEMDVECGVCRGKGCRLCKNTGWLEILGSGMVNIKVLEAAGIDGEIYQGFAFGLGVERITMLKYGIDDLRAFFENDIRFLEQF